ncbi:hypothetical protein NCS52_00712200 [Fusarium sp. LHS14.1]|nr:hypothetical protein NCS52_00712200 [Fusarium sp. LHS14.1]
MEVALTFGSLGDIIQLCQLAIQLTQAVGVGCQGAGESVKEYQELRDDLGLFVRILTQVVATYEKHESSPYLEGLDRTSKSVVDETTSLIQDALNHFKSRYGSSLRPQGSDKTLKDVFKKVEWSIREGDRIRCLRTKLQDNIQRLALLASLAARKSARVDTATLFARMTEVKDLVSKTCSNHEIMLDSIRQQRKVSEEQVKKLDEVSQQLVKQDTSSRNILAVAGEALSAILQVKDLLVQVSQDVIDVHIVFNSMFLRSMDPTKELPAIIEDALGRHVPIPPDWLDFLDWTALYKLLSCRFEGQNGHDMVIRRAYALEESVSGKDLDTGRPLRICLRRGMRIHMSMTAADTPEGVTVQCPRSGCGMWFNLRRTNSSQTNLLEDGRATSLGKAAETSTPAKPADFQRVRLFRRDADVAIPDTALSYSQRAQPFHHDADMVALDPYAAVLDTNPALQDETFPPVGGKGAPKKGRDRTKMWTCGKCWRSVLEL